jgi:uncharacterized UPF0160 family protein
MSWCPACPAHAFPGALLALQCVPPGPGSFDQRKSMPDSWKGLRDDALSAACGVPGGVFVHASGFIGGNATYEGVLEMARKAVAA